MIKLECKNLLEWLAKIRPIREAVLNALPPQEEGAVMTQRDAARGHRDGKCATRIYSTDESQFIPNSELLQISTSDIAQHNKIVGTKIAALQRLLGETQHLERIIPLFKKLKPGDRIIFCPGGGSDLEMVISEIDGSCVTGTSERGTETLNFLSHDADFGWIKEIIPKDQTSPVYSK